MTKSYIEIARTRRLVALAAVADRKSNGATVTKIHTLTGLTQRHVDTVFRTCRTVPAPMTEVALAA